MNTPWPIRLLSIVPSVRRYLAQAKVDDGAGWTRAGGSSPSWDDPKTYQNQIDALDAWRESPLGHRIISLTTDYVVGDGIHLRSNNQDLERFIRKFWAANNLDIQLGDICDELGRAGELFPVLHPQIDGVALLRFVPATEINGIETLPEDYQTELAYNQGTRQWHSRNRPEAGSPVMLHYAVNRPIGALRGESDLRSVLKTLKNYSSWLDDRVRLNWAARMWLWIVTVPTGKVLEKREQYKNPPQPGSIVIKDDGEQWEMLTPNLAARDASTDGKTMRYMIAAGAGVPLHMLGEAEGTNLATAQAQEDPTLRHYRRRQLYMSWMLKDIVLCAYAFYMSHRGRSARYTTRLHSDIVASCPDISRNDNTALATAGRDIVTMLAKLREELRASDIPSSGILDKKTVELAFRFAGEILSEDEINQILRKEE